MGTCLSSPETPERSESHENLLSTDPESSEEHSRVIDRSTVPQTIINISRDGPPPPRPVTYLDIPVSSPVNGFSSHNFPNPIKSEKGKEIIASLQEAYKWKESYKQPTLEFSYKTNLLFTSCEQHLTELSTEITEEAMTECDAIVRELQALRTHWGTELLPLSMRNAFVRERMNLMIGEEQRQFRVDCIQFFEPIVFYGNVPGKQEDLVKLFVFVVTDIENEEVLIRYYLERSFLFDFYHVLCFFKGNSRGQLKPYGTHCPPYWTIRQHMLENALIHLENVVSQGKEPGLQPIAATTFPTVRNTGPVNI